MLSIGDSLNILSKVDKEYKNTSQSLLQLNSNLRTQQTILNNLIGSDASSATITNQTNTVNAIKQSIGQNLNYVKLLSTAKTSAETVLNVSVGVSTTPTTPSTTNPFAGPTGPEGPYGVQGDPGVVGPTGAAGTSVTFDSVPTSGSPNLVSSDGVYKAIQSITSVTPTYISPISFPPAPVTGQLLTDGIYLYCCTTGGTPGIWKRNLLV